MSLVGLPTTVERHDTPPPGWLEVYLSAITPNRRAINQQILRGIPQPRAFLLASRNGQPLATGLGVVKDSVGIVECMATRAEVRRTGAAHAVLDGIEHFAAERGARTLCLQVVSDNVPAIRLYEKAGYEPISVTRYFTR